MLPVAVCSLIGSTATLLRSRTNLRRLIAVASPTGGIYNIACEAAGLPADASAAASAFGNRWFSDFPDLRRAVPTSELSSQCSPLRLYGLRIGFGTRSAVVSQLPGKCRRAVARATSRRDARGRIGERQYHGLLLDHPDEVRSSVLTSAPGQGKASGPIARIIPTAKAEVLP